MDQFWGIPTNNLLAQLGTTSDGLTTLDAERRLKAHGLNMSRVKSQITPFSLLINQLKSPLVLLLIFAMGLSFFLGETTDALIVLSVVLLSTLLGFFQEYRATNAVAKLLDIIKTRVIVLRDGANSEIPFEQVVPGDVVLLSAGGAIPADCVLLEEKDLFVDEATLTGESYPAEKHVGVLPENTPLARRTNMLFQGTHVVSGTAKAIVVQTGAQTLFGEISARLQLRPPETEFERGIRIFGDMLIKITLILVMALFAINVFFAKPVVNSFLFALALAVGLTPELLPAIVSITLANGAQRMAKKKVIVKRLAAIENFGSMNVLCSDKTGTLTEGMVKLAGAIDVNGNTSEQVMRLAYLNASFESGFVNPIDTAIRELKQFEADRALYKKIDEVPYDFIRKRLSIVAEKDSQHTMITKGAVPQVLPVCSEARSNGGRLIALDSIREQLDQLYQRYSHQGFRVLAVATRDVTGDPLINKEDEHDLTLEGFLLLEDPIKAGIANTLRELKKLGVSLKIITGDNQHVAESVSARVGLSSPNLLTGPELQHLSDEALRQRVNSVDVFAEVEPNQKERILLALRKTGNVVGYMGDGINDASALHAADVGISVASAVDVAKEAADIVLLEHDLNVLVQGVRDGRVTFANTLKYMFTTTSANFGNMFSMAGASLFLPFLPLLPKQILLNNFLSDLPSMTIATDSVDHELVDQPRKWDIVFIRNFMIVFGLVSSIFDYLTFGVLLFYMRANAAEFQTGWFIESLMTELFITIVVRTRRPFFQSKPSAILATSVLVVAGTTIFLPYTALGALFGFVPLPLGFMALLLAITLLYLLASELAKKWFYARYRN